MAALSWCLIICTLLASLARADDVGFPPQPMTSSSTSRPTSPPTPTPSTPTTPSTPPTTRSPPPTTPSTPLTTSSTPSTTPSTPPTTPSTLPTTSTSPPPTTPAPPKPVVPGTWHVDYNHSNTSCILLKMAAVIDISYETTKNTTNTTPLTIWPSATADGECGNVTQNITLKWSSLENAAEKNQSIKFVFNKNGTKFDLDEVVLNIVMDDKQIFPDSKDTNKTLSHVKKDFVTTVGNSYKCDKTQTFNLTQSNSNTIEGKIQISNLQLQAFHNATAKQFAEAVDCEPYETPDIVPIAVGCALAALIVIVLITYLIGRRRNQARGYLSM